MKIFLVHYQRSLMELQKMQKLKPLNQYQDLHEHRGLYYRAPNETTQNSGYWKLYLKATNEQ